MCGAQDRVRGVVEKRSSEEDEEDVDGWGRDCREEERQERALGMVISYSMPSVGPRAVEEYSMGKQVLTTSGLGPDVSVFLRSPGRAFLAGFACWDPATGRHSTA